MTSVVGIEVAVAAEAVIGEGPWWDERTQTLGWVDIPRGRVHLQGPSGRQIIHAGESVGVVRPHADGGLVVAADLRLMHVDLATGVQGARELAVAPPTPRGAPPVRWNDGACDPLGRFWVGTMAVDEEPHQGTLFRWDGVALTTVLTGVSISNGIGWSLDGTSLYYIDSPTRMIQVFPYDMGAGELDAHGIRSLDLTSYAGVPDGLTVDAEGGLWVAFYGGSSVRCFDPAGSLRQEIDLPVPQPTSCAFGGSDLDRLFVTSARDGMTQAQLAEHPESGSVLVLEPGPRGRPVARCAG